MDGRVCVCGQAGGRWGGERRGCGEIQKRQAVRRGRARGRRAGETRQASRGGTAAGTPACVATSPSPAATSSCPQAPSPLPPGPPRTLPSPPPPPHLALQVCRILLCDDASDGGGDEDVAGHGEDGFLGQHHAAGEGGQAAGQGPARCGEAAASNGVVWWWQGGRPWRAQRSEGNGRGGRAGGRRAAAARAEAHSRRPAAPLTMPGPRPAPKTVRVHATPLPTPVPTPAPAFKTVCPYHTLHAPPVPVRQVAPQLGHLQAVLVGHSAKGVGHRHHTAAHLVKDLGRPGAHVAKALRAAAGAGVGVGWSGEAGGQRARCARCRPGKLLPGAHCSAVPRPSLQPLRHPPADLATQPAAAGALQPTWITKLLFLISPSP